MLILLLLLFVYVLCEDGVLLWYLLFLLLIVNVLC